MSYDNSPPPPPPSFGAPGYGLSPAGELAPWPMRAGGFLIDYLLYIPGFILYYLGAPKPTATTVNGYATVATVGGSVVLTLLGALLTLGVAIWNRWIKGGAGQSIGKRVVGLRLLGEATGQPIGAGQAFLRDLAHIIDSIICYVGWLFPLWDAKKQTIADKIVKTVVVKA